MRTFVHASAVAAIAVVATALPSQAASLTLRDATADVWSWTEATSKYVQAGAIENVDLTKTVIRHTKRSLFVKATYAELTKQNGILATTLRIRTHTGAKRLAYVMATTRRPQGRHELERESTGATIACAGMKHTISYAENTVTLSIPRSCLKSPDWVQLRVASVKARRLGSAKYYIDDAASTRAQPKEWTAKVRANGS